MMTRVKAIILANLVFISICPVLMLVVAFVSGPDEYLGLIHDETEAARHVKWLLEFHQHLVTALVVLDCVAVLACQTVRLLVVCWFLLITGSQTPQIIFRYAYGVANGDFSG